MYGDIMGDFDFLSQPGSSAGPPRAATSGSQIPRRPGPVAAPQRQSTTPSSPPDFGLSQSPAVRQVPRQSPKALLLLSKILRVCGYLYLLGFVLSSIFSVVCLVVLFTSGGGTIAGDQIGLWLSAMLFCGIGAVGSFAAAELIKLAIRGVQAMEETASLLRSMQRG